MSSGSHLFDLAPSASRGSRLTPRTHRRTPEDSPRSIPTRPDPRSSPQRNTHTIT